MGKFDNYTLVSDLDGTLLNKEGMVSNKNLEAVNYFKNQGGKFTVATGRTVNRCSFLSNMPDLDLPGIFSNGTTIAELNTKTVLWQRSLDLCIKDIICDLENKYKNLGVLAFSKDKDFVINLNEYKKFYSDLNGFNLYECKAKDIEFPLYKVSLISENNIVDLLNKEYSKYLNRVYFTKSNTYVYEILDKTVNKGSALNILKDIAELQSDKIIAVGDNLNDLEFLDVAHIGVAVGGECVELAKKADIVLPGEDVIYNLITKLS